MFLAYLIIGQATEGLHVLVHLIPASASWGRSLCPDLHERSAEASGNQGLARGPLSSQTDRVSVTLLLLGFPARARFLRPGIGMVPILILALQMGTPKAREAKKGLVQGHTAQLLCGPARGRAGLAGSSAPALTMTPGCLFL